MKLPFIAIALFGYQINVADPLTFNQDRPLSTFENFYVSEIYQPTMNPSFLGPRIVETRLIRKATRPRQICPTDENLVCEQQRFEQNVKPENENSRAKKSIRFTFINRTNIPALAQIYVRDMKDNIGFFDYTLDAHSQKKFLLKELYWVTQKTNDYKINERFQILNHGLPNKLTIVVPNQKDQTFDIAQGNYTITLSQMSDKVMVNIQQ